MSAICLSGQNSSFVLHGPPGTGKSQTITNMIANALYHGKTVLFIAEKMAALSVVQKRLEAIGLGPFCLELHSNKAKKKDVLSQLDSALNVGRIKAPEEYEKQAERLYELRKKLNGIVEEIHKVRAFGFSLYETVSKTEQYKDYPCSVNFTDNDIASLTKERFNEWCELCEKLSLIDKECRGIYANPLKGVDLEEYSMNTRDAAGRMLGEFIKTLNEYVPETDKCSRLIGCSMDTNESIDAVKELCETIIHTGYLPATIVQNKDIELYGEQVSLVCAEGKTRDSVRASILDEFSEQIFNYNYEVEELAWKEAEAKWFLPKFFAQKKIYKRLKSYARDGRFVKSRVPEFFEAMHSYQSSCNAVDSAKDIFENLFGAVYNNGNADWEKLENIYNSGVNINRGISAAKGNKTEMLNKVALLIENNDTDTLDEFLQLYEKIDSYKKQLAQLLNIDFNTFALSELTEKSKQLKDNMDNLRNWCSYNRLKSEIRRNGLDCLVECVESEKIDDILAVFYRSIYNSCARWIIANEDSLSSFNGVMMRKDLESYKAVCREFEQLTRNELAARLSANIPDIRTGALSSSEAGILQKAIKSGGRMMSVRKLFDSIPNLLRKLAPCMLMSPISVAQYIDPSYPQFDLVIFDEASQMPTCEAVGAIARGKNLVVVGDPKQLPPTSFFSSNHVDEDNMELEDMESILDDCLALSMPQEHLLWHYRSRHESLIAFSNRKYYDNKLYTFPSPYDKISRVSFVPVKGFYDRGRTKRNIAEAEAVVNEIERRLKDPELSKESLGVVTFNVVQQNLISDMIDELFAKHPEYEEASKSTGEELFIKNLENVQGDERDVILFSIGYGPDENGKLALNFGPLNRDGGWRRLNVAVSRARKEMLVFSVLRPEQIDVSRSRAEGVKSIKDFLEFAMYGTRALTVKNTGHEKEKDILVDAIADEIRKKGYEVNTNIGCSEFRIDIGVVHPENKDKYAIGIMLDGINYASSGTSRDRNIVQESVMKSLGWYVSRIMVLDWFENPEKEKERIFNEITQVIKAEPTQKAAETVSQSRTEFARETEPQGDELSEYRVCKLETMYAGAENLILPQYKNTVKKQLLNIIKTEAPISKTMLKKRLLESWGISRGGARINRYIDELLVGMNISQITYGDKGFLYNGSPDSYTEFRVPGTEKRNIDDISPEELSEAVKYIIGIQISVNESDLDKEVAKLFGFARCTAAMKSYIRGGIIKAEERGYIRYTDGNITII